MLHEKNESLRVELRVQIDPARGEVHFVIPNPDEAKALRHWLAPGSIVSLRARVLEVRQVGGFSTEPLISEMENNRRNFFPELQTSDSFLVVPVGIELVKIDDTFTVERELETGKGLTHE